MLSNQLRPKLLGARTRQSDTSKRSSMTAWKRSSLPLRSIIAGRYTTKHINPNLDSDVEVLVGLEDRCGQPRKKREEEAVERGKMSPRCLPSINSYNPTTLLTSLMAFSECCFLPHSHRIHLPSTCYSRIDYKVVFTYELTF